MEKEIWKDIPGYEGIYQVSNQGRVKSLGNNSTRKEKILKPSANGNGYYRIELWLNGNKRKYCVHQLVAMAFLNHNPCGYKFVVDHINDNSLDNRVENLQIITNRENSRKTQGRYSSKYKGVCWNKKSNKWQVAIRINGRSKHLGLFINEFEASLVYNNYLNKII